MRTVLPIPEPPKPPESAATTSTMRSRIVALVPRPSCSITSPVASVKVERLMTTLEFDPSPIVTYSSPLPENPPRPLRFV